MKTVMKKLLSVMLVALLLVSAVPFQASAGAQYNVDIHIILGATGNDVAETLRLTLEEGSVVSPAMVKKQVEWMVVPNYPGYTYYGSTLTEDLTLTGNMEVFVRLAAEVPDVTEPQPTETEPQPTETEPVAPGKLTIVVYAYDASYNAKEIGTVVKEGASSYTLNKALAEECFAKVGLVNYEEYKWWPKAGSVDLSDGNDVEVALTADPVMTPGNKKIITITLMHNDGTDTRQYIEALAGDEILEAIKADKNYKEPTRKGYKFAGWSFDMNCSQDVGRDDVANSDIKIFAEWEKVAENNKYDVTLRVYLNGDALNVDRTFDMSGYGDVITQAEVKSVINKYYTAKSGYTLSYHGLFTTKTWDDGDYDLDDAVSSIEVNKDGKTVIYVMVKNVKVVEADSTNPKTGDGIVIALATMMSTGGAALALGKKKFF